MTYRQWLFRHRFKAIALAVLAVVLIAAAFALGLISPPQWIASTSAKIEEKSPSKAVDQATSAASARFAAEGAARSADSSASSARSASASASAAHGSEKRAATAAVRAEDAAARAEAAAGKAKPAKPEKTTARKSPKSQSPAAPTQPVAEPAAVEPGASGGFRWVHFGVAPYASSREEAMQKRASAFRSMGLPSAVVTQLLFATDMPSEKARIVPGDHLDAMLSKGGVVHRDVTVAFVPPAHGMEFTAVAEKWSVTWGGRTYTVLLPEVCNNWSVIIGPAPLVPLQAIAPPPPAAAPQAVPVRGACPDVYTLKVNDWQHSALALPGVERTHAGEELEEKFTYVPHVSREHGKQFRDAYKAGTISRSTVMRTFRVSLIMTPEAHGGAPTITSEEVVGEVTFAGLKELRFKRTTLEKWDAIRVVAVDGDVTSPPAYHRTGLHEVRFFNHLPGKQLGEWDDNPVPDCIMNEHWID